MERYVTRGIADTVPEELQMCMWHMIDELPVTKDYLQVFELSEANGHQKIIHRQEQPAYQKEYAFSFGWAMHCKIYVIDNVMMFPYER